MPEKARYAWNPTFVANQPYQSLSAPRKNLSYSHFISSHVFEPQAGTYSSCRSGFSLSTYDLLIEALRKVLFVYGVH